MRSINGVMALILLVTAATVSRADSGEDLIRRSRAGGIDVAVRVERLESLAGESVDHLEFTVSLDTHVADLFQFDIADLSELVIDGSAREEVAFEWMGDSETSHHRNGTLHARIPGDTLSLESGDEVELRIHEIGTDVRTFTWEL